MIKANLNNEMSQERVSKWQLSRGDFLRSLVAIGVSTQLVSCYSPNDSNSKLSTKRITPLMTNQQARILIKVQSILFPDDGNGPSAEEINAFPYLLWYLQDELIEKYERDFYMRGADWVEQESLDLFNISFLDLPEKTQLDLVHILSMKKRTKQWLSKLLTFIFEALLADPIYGGNPNNIGWDWLNHDPGSPRSEGELIYPNIIRTVRNEI